MKTKTPKCAICKEIMKVIYTKRAYKFNGKYKTYWQKEGYLCNNFYQPTVFITGYRDISKGKAKGNYLVGVYDTTTTELLEILPIIVAPLTRSYYRRHRTKITHYKRKYNY